MGNKPFYMVYLENGGAPTYTHSTLENAQNEAKRLARELKRKAYVLMAVKSYELNEFKEETLFDLEDRLPF